VSPQVHPGAAIDPSAILGEGCVVGEGVSIGPGCHIGHHVVIHDGTVVGRDVRVDDLATLGTGGHEPCSRLAETAAIEAAGQRVGLREQPRMFFRPAPLLHLDGKLTITAPAEDDQRDIEQERVG